MLINYGDNFVFSFIFGSFYSLRGRGVTGTIVRMYGKEVFKQAAFVLFMKIRTAHKADSTEGPLNKESEERHILAVVGQFNLSNILISKEDQGFFSCSVNIVCITVFIPMTI